jgi:D-arabinose 1-dehydrogenase-like Zn-dependent alcohol dehydrogenase
MTTAIATMRAVRFDRAGGRLTLEQVPVPEPGPGEVLVRIRACGICLSDVHLIEGYLPAPLAQVTPGHEIAGTIERIGDQVSFWRPGMPVVLFAAKPCGSCLSCAKGDPTACAHPLTMGSEIDGGWAEYIVVPAVGLIPMPDHLPFEQAAILADAVSTPYAGLIETGRLRPAEAVGLWGIGGLGVHAVQTARLVGATPIIAIDPNPAARERALAFGADHALDPDAVDVREEVLRLTDGRGLDLAVDLFGANSVLAQAESCLALAGRVVMVGLSSEPVRLGGPGVLFGVQSHALLGHMGYQKRHLEQVVRLVGAGRLDVSRSISDVLPLEEAAHGVERLSTKQGNPIRLVLKP